MTVRRRLWLAIIVLSGIAVSGMALASVQSPIRPLLTLWFLLLCPGMALVPLLRVRSRLTELALAVLVSLCADTIVSMSMLYAGLWSPSGGVIALVLLSVVGARLQLGLKEPSHAPRNAAS